MLCIHVALAQEQLIPLDKELSQVSYPYPTDFHLLKSQDQILKMAYIDAKPAQQDYKTVLLLHGKNFNAAYWDETIKSLTDNGYRVIAPDQIGFGKSTKPESYQYSFHQLASNTKSILDSLNIKKVFVLGHSMGGMLATRFTLMYPQSVEKLILENPIGLEDYKTLATYQKIEKAYQAELKNTPESYRNYQMKFYYDNQWKTSYDKWLNLLAGWTLHKDYPIIAWNAALTSDMIFTQPVVYELPNLKAPTLLLIGTRDRTALAKDRTPAEIQESMGRYDLLGKKTQQAIPQSRLIEFEGIGHLPHIESFDKFIRSVLEFIHN